MKKYIFVFLFCFIIMLIPVSARAGGGNGGGSGGGSSGTPHHYHDNDDRKEIYPGTSFLVIVGMLGVVYYIKHEKIKKLHKQAKMQINNAYDKDNFWDEKILKQKVKEAYYQIQQAWSQQDLKTLKKYLSDDLYKQWEIKIEWQRYRNERNQLSHILLISKHIVSIYDDDNNDKDYFWVAIEGKMNDVMLSSEEVVDSNNEVFIEYWKFIRNHDYILLDRILQEDEYDYINER